MADMDDIRSRGAAAIDSLLQGAFEAGVAHGKKAAAKELQAKISEVLSIGDSVEAVIVKGTHATGAAGNAFVEVRAAPGTVKPELLRVIAARPYELTTEDLIATTGFKPNSVRGTLSTLMSEGAITKHNNNRWVTAERFLADGNPSPSTENPGAGGAGED